MFRNDISNKTKFAHKQQGASLVMAIIMIVVFSMMAAVMVKIVSSSSENISFEVLGTRAYTAATIGNQWALQRLFPLNSIGSCANVNGQTLPTISNTNGLTGCQISNLVCSAVVVDAVSYFTITSTGTCGSGEVSTSRTLKVDGRSL